MNKKHSSRKRTARLETVCVSVVASELVVHGGGGPTWLLPMVYWTSPYTELPRPSPAPPGYGGPTVQRPSAPALC